jgi:hypothetical protein
LRDLGPAYRATLIAVPVAFLALATPVSSTLEHLGAGTPPSQAATDPLAQQRLQNQRCVSAWNGDPSDRWRNLARAAGARIAQVGVVYAVTLEPGSKKRPVSRLSGCVVSLELARTPSPYQPTLTVYAPYAGGVFHFNRMRRGHVRTAAPAANAHVTAAGGLALSTQKLLQSCPQGPVGSRIQSVEAVTQKRRLSLNGTTRLTGAAEPFAVTVQNDGLVPIRGAIASFGVYGTTRPDRPLWRSKPVTVRRLGPGASVVVRFTPPPLGHGVRVLRAITAALECETRFSDNSPEFLVRAS